MEHPTKVHTKIIIVYIICLYLGKNNQIMQLIYSINEVLLTMVSEILIMHE